LSLNQFFGYFGSKQRLASRYPRPRHDTIIEPFAGGAGYSVHHHHKRVILVEKNPEVAALWRYLTHVKASEILRLPDIADGQSVADLAISAEARSLIGFWLGTGDAKPRNVRSPWRSKTIELYRDSWCRTVRARIASQVDKIRHWQIIEGDYTAAPDIEADWFVDPPYQVAGTVYPCSSEDIDFPALGSWCRTRRGQVMVCENVGAKWLPFRPFRSIQSASSDNTKRSSEAIWTNDLPAGDALTRAG
jgi:hypothetical protein